MIKKLSPEEKEKVVGVIDSYYGSKLVIEGIFLLKEEKREAKKIFLYTGERLPGVPAEWTGQHFCTLKENDVILSIEGAQAVGKTAGKMIGLSYEEARYIMSGRDLGLKEAKEKGYYILKTGDDILGIGLIADEKKIINQTPKSRRTLQQFRTI